MNLQVAPKQAAVWKSLQHVHIPPIVLKIFKQLHCEAGSCMDSNPTKNPMNNFPHLFSQKTVSKIEKQTAACSSQKHLQQQNRVSPKQAAVWKLLQHVHIPSFFVFNNFLNQLQCEAGSCIDSNPTKKPIFSISTKSPCFFYQKNREQKRESRQPAF